MSESPDNLRDQLLDVIATAKDSEKLREKLFSERLLTKVTKFAGSRGDEVRALQDLAFRRLADLDSQREIIVAEWQRARSGIEHENILVNHRLTWLFTSQAFLFTAYTLAFNQWAKNESMKPDAVNLYPWLLGIIAFTGIVICGVIWRATTGAVSQLRRLDNWWHVGRTADDLIKRIEPQNALDRKAKVNKTLMYNPPLQGELRVKLDPFLASEAIPVYFILTWAAILIFTVWQVHGEIWQAIKAHSLEVVVVMVVVGIFAGAIYLIHTKFEKLKAEIVRLRGENQVPAKKKNKKPSDVSSTQKKKAA